MSEGQSPPCVAVSRQHCHRHHPERGGLSVPWAVRATSSRSCHAESGTTRARVCIEPTRRGVGDGFITGEGRAALSNPGCGCGVFPVVSSRLLRRQRVTR